MLLGWVTGGLLDLVALVYWVDHVYLVDIVNIVMSAFYHYVLPAPSNLVDQVSGQGGPLIKTGAPPVP